MTFRALSSAVDPQTGRKTIPEERIRPDWVFAIEPAGVLWADDDEPFLSPLEIPPQRVDVHLIPARFASFVL